MAVTQRGVFLEGLSGDTKPTTGIPVPCYFTETDTAFSFIWNGASWVARPRTVYTTFIMGDSSATLAVGTDKNPLPMEATGTLTIKEVRLKVKTAPTGAALIVDVNKNGTTIFTTQTNRPQIAIGATEGNTTTIEVSGLVKGDDITFDIDQIGSTIAGGALVVEVICEQMLH